MLRYPAPVDGGPSRASRILAVDDSLMYLDVLAATLEDEGYEVVVAESGAQALEKLATENVDCILLDRRMPGLSGDETCRRIKASPAMRDVPVIMLTSEEGRSSVLEGLGAGADDYISKSNDVEVLKARVFAQLRRRRLEDEHRRMREDLLRTEREAIEARASRQLAETRAALVAELERKNAELEAFTCSVSHDLRAPLRSIHGFSQALVEEYGSQLDDTALGYLRRVSAAAQRMGELIDDLLALSRVGMADLVRRRVDLSALAAAVAAALRDAEPHRSVSVEIESGLVAEADPRLVRIALENLIGNAWKFSANNPTAKIGFGLERRDDELVFSVRDNGAGFDPRLQRKLFRPFQRLHSEAEFPGTGIGLATVQRIIERHGGRVWAEGRPDGASFYFTIPSHVPTS